MVESLIETGAPINSKTISDETPLDVAVSSGVSGEVVKVLVDAGAGSTDIQRLFTETLRAQPGVDHIKSLIEAGAAVNMRDEFGDTPLETAVHYGVGVKSLAALVDSGADASTTPTILNEYLWTRDVSAEYASLLIGAGAQVNMRDETGDLPIDIAVSRNLCNDVLQTLIDAGANASSSNTILHSLLLSGSPSPHQVRLIIDAGARINARDENGDAPIDIVFEQELKDDVSWTLTEAGADVSRVPLILHRTLREENPSIERVKLLIANGAPIDALDYEEHSPLDIAFSNCVDVEIIWALVEAGADVEDTSNLLHRVLRNPSVKPVHVEMLTNMGVELNAKDYLWSTPIEIAIERDLSPEIFRVLVDAGAHWASYPNTVQDKLKRASGT